VSCQSNWKKEDLISGDSSERVSVEEDGKGSRRESPGDYKKREGNHTRRGRTEKKLVLNGPLYAWDGAQIKLIRKEKGKRFLRQNSTGQIKSSGRTSGTSRRTNVKSEGNPWSNVRRQGGEEVEKAGLNNSLRTVLGKGVKAYAMTSG